jgi:hypothetical protein
MRTLALILVAVVIAALQGCIGFYEYRNTLVTVTDQSSGEPVTGVRVRTIYRADLPGLVNDPRVAEAVTDDAGCAVMSIATWWDSSLVVDDHAEFRISDAFVTDERGRTAHFGHDSKALAERRELTFLRANATGANRFRVTIAPFEGSAK